MILGRLGRREWGRGHELERGYFQRALVVQQVRPHAFWPADLICMHLVSFALPTSFPLRPLACFGSPMPIPNVDRQSTCIWGRDMNGSPNVDWRGNKYHLGSGIPSPHSSSRRGGVTRRISVMTPKTLRLSICLGFGYAHAILQAFFVHQTRQRVRTS